MEWLTHGTYTYETLHPPLSRVSAALLPYLSGLRSQDKATLYPEGTAILNSNGRYAHNLLLARLGLLPYYWLTCLFVFLFARRHLSSAHAMVAVIVLAFCPIVLADCALAITDAPLMAFFFATIVTASTYLQRLTLRNGAVFALSLGLAVLSKFTAIPFFAFSIIALLTQHWLASHNTQQLRASRLKPLFSLALPVLGAALVLWAGYRFSFTPLFTPSTMHHEAQEKLAHLPPAARTVLTRLPVPAPEFFRGLYLAHQDTSPTHQLRMAFLLGQDYFGGRWDYFPVCLLAKTPIPTLILAAIGLLLCLLWLNSPRARIAAILLAGVFGPLLFAMLTNVNIGLRHILPVFPFIALLAAVGALHLWNLPVRQALFPRAIVLLLLAWCVETTLLASPEFLPYFNEAAAPFAGYITIDSNIDWGQDLYKLEDRLNGVPPGDVWLHYNGDSTIVRHASARWHDLQPGTPHTGWIAISETPYQFLHAGYAWLDTHPYTRIGRSIRLYHIPPAP